MIASSSRVHFSQSADDIYFIVLLSLPLREPPAPQGCPQPSHSQGPPRAAGIVTDPAVDPRS